MACSRAGLSFFRGFAPSAAVIAFAASSSSLIGLVSMLCLLHLAGQGNQNLFMWAIRQASVIRQHRVGQLVRERGFGLDLPLKLFGLGPLAIFQIPLLLPLGESGVIALGNLNRIMLCAIELSFSRRGSASSTANRIIGISYNGGGTSFLGCELSDTIHYLGLPFPALRSVLFLWPHQNGNSSTSINFSQSFRTSPLGSLSSKAC